MAKRRQFKDLPEHAAAWVKATVLSASLSSALACGPTLEDQPPTCGPCCHGAPDCDAIEMTTGDSVELESNGESGEEQNEGANGSESDPSQGDADRQRDDSARGDDDGEGEDPMLMEDRQNRHPIEAPTCGPCCHGSNDPECEPSRTNAGARR